MVVFSQNQDIFSLINDTKETNRTLGNDRDTVTQTHPLTDRQNENITLLLPSSANSNYNVKEIFIWRRQVKGKDDKPQTLETQFKVKNH